MVPSESAGMRAAVTSVKVPVPSLRYRRFWPGKEFPITRSRSRSPSTSPSATASVQSESAGIRPAVASVKTPVPSLRYRRFCEWLPSTASRSRSPSTSPSAIATVVSESTGR